ncbi:GNAT family N-acetyltransferase [Solibacillus sp. CAU 1738]|uniref:GNAT family N-acetyltransferase n=1 Tax=Solibacillus sp. CAU 1738 TaxID=3140363 RepID=UPI003260A2E8
MELKILVENDLTKCTSTFIEVFNDEPWNDEWTFTKAKKYLLDFYNTPGFLGVLAVENEEIIGFIFGVHRIWWSGDEFFINEMCVKLQHQNKGIGRLLLNHLITELDNSNISNITLLTDRGIPAEEFYKKSGFEEIERLIFLSKNIKSGI